MPVFHNVNHSSTPIITEEDDFDLLDFLDGPIFEMDDFVRASLSIVSNNAAADALLSFSTSSEVLNHGNLFSCCRYSISFLFFKLVVSL